MRKRPLQIIAVATCLTVHQWAICQNSQKPTWSTRIEIGDFVAITSETNKAVLLGTSGIVCLDAKTGKKEWSKILPNDATETRLSLAGSFVWISFIPRGTTHSTILQLRLHDGRESGRFDLTGFIDKRVIGGQRGFTFCLIPPSEAPKLMYLEAGTNEARPGHVMTALSSGEVFSTGSNLFLITGATSYSKIDMARAPLGSPDDVIIGPKLGPEWRHLISQRVLFGLHSFYSKDLRIGERSEQSLPDAVEGTSALSAYVVDQNWRPLRLWTFQSHGRGPDWGIGATNEVAVLGPRIFCRTPTKVYEVSPEGVVLRKFDADTVLRTSRDIYLLKVSEGKSKSVAVTPLSGARGFRLMMPASSHPRFASLSKGIVSIQTLAGNSIAIISRFEAR